MNKTDPQPMCLCLLGNHPGLKRLESAIAVSGNVYAVEKIDENDIHYLNRVELCRPDVVFIATPDMYREVKRNKPVFAGIKVVFCVVDDELSSRAIWEIFQMEIDGIIVVSKNREVVEQQIRDLTGKSGGMQTTSAILRWLHSKGASHNGGQTGANPG